MANGLYKSMKDLIEKAKAGQITMTLESDPGGDRAMLEGHLNEFPDLLVAYSRFASNLTLGESEVGKSLMRRALKTVEEIKEEDEGRN